MKRQTSGRGRCRQFAGLRPFPRSVRRRRPWEVSCVGQLDRRDVADCKYVVVVCLQRSRRRRCGVARVGIRSGHTHRRTRCGRHDPQGPRSARAQRLGDQRPRPRRGRAGQGARGGARNVLGGDGRRLRRALRRAGGPARHGRRRFAGRRGDDRPESRKRGPGPPPLGRAHARRTCSSRSTSRVGRRRTTHARSTRSCRRTWRATLPPPTATRRRPRRRAADTRPRCATRADAGISVHLDTGVRPCGPRDATIFGDWGGHNAVDAVKEDDEWNGVEYLDAWKKEMSEGRRGFFHHALVYATGGGQTREEQFAARDPSARWVPLSIQSTQCVYLGRPRLSPSAASCCSLLQRRLARFAARFVLRNSLPPRYSVSRRRARARCAHDGQAPGARTR